MVYYCIYDIYYYGSTNIKYVIYIIIEGIKDKFILERGENDEI